MTAFSMPHLHLHLEASERGADGAARHNRRAAPRSREEFFARHSARVPIRHLYSDARILEQMLLSVVEEQRLERVDYVELRVSPRRWLRSGLSLGAFFTTIDNVLRSTRAPVVRAVILLNRAMASRDVDRLAAALDAELPLTIVGVDIAGDELRFPDCRRFERFFERARARGLGVTTHAGEFGPSSHIWEALDNFGAHRIGHGLSAPESTALLRRLASDRVLVEVSLTTNCALGAVPAGALHPVGALFRAGVPICFNTDVPIQTGCDLSAEVALARDALGLNEEGVRDIQAAAAAFRFPPP